MVPFSAEYEKLVLATAGNPDRRDREKAAA